MFAARVSCSVPAINMPAVLIANGLGVCLMLVVIFNKYRHAKWASYDSRLFHWMCRICLTLCILETAGFLWDRKVFLGSTATVHYGERDHLFVEFCFGLYMDLLRGLSFVQRSCSIAKKLYLGNDSGGNCLFNGSS